MLVAAAAAGVISHLNVGNQKPSCPLLVLGMSGPPPPPRRRKPSSGAVINRDSNNTNMTPTISEEPQFSNKHQYGGSSSSSGNIMNNKELDASNNTDITQGLPVAGSAYNAVMKQRSSMEFSVEKDRTEVCTME